MAKVNIIPTIDLKTTEEQSTITGRPAITKKYFEMDSYLEDKRFTYTWRIQNFSYIDKPSGFLLSSKSFGASKIAKWTLQVFKSDSEESDTENIGVYLIAESLTSARNVRYKLCLKGKNGREYFAKVLQTDFKNPNERGGIPSMVSRRELIDNKEIIVDDVLTVYCELFVPQVPVCGKAIPIDEEQANCNPFEIVNLTSLSKHFGQMFKDGKFADVTLKASDKKFAAHRVVLSAHSSVFESILQNEALREMDMTDGLEEPVLKDFLEFLYTGKMEMDTIDKSILLLKVGLKYQVKALINICVEFVCNNINLRNFYDVAVIAETYDEPDLKAAVRTVFGKHCRSIFLETEWENFKISRPNIAEELVKFYSMEP